MPLVVKQEPIVYRNFITGAGNRGIGVGYPERAHLAFDANDLRLAMIWQGAFMDARRHWTGRGEGFEPASLLRVDWLAFPLAAACNLDLAFSSAERLGYLACRRELLDHHVAIRLAHDSLDVGVDVAGHDDEVARLRPHRVVLARLDIEHLDASDVGALAGDRSRPCQVLESFVQRLELLIDGAEQRLIASSANLALFLCVLSPDVLAHGQLVTTDVGIALFTFLSVIAFDAASRRVSVARVVLAGLAAGAAFATKFSAVLLLPILASLALVAVVAPEPMTLALPGRPPREVTRRRARAVAMVGVLAAIAVLSLLVVWGSYGFTSRLSLHAETTIASPTSRIRTTRACFDTRFIACIFTLSRGPAPTPRRQAREGRGTAPSRRIKQFVRLPDGCRANSACCPTQYQQLAQGVLGTV